jgi:hypothetical protein
MKPKPKDKTEKGKFPPAIFNRGLLAKKRGEAYRREREMLSKTSLGDMIK